MPTNTTNAVVTKVAFLTTQQGPNSSSIHDNINPRSAVSVICLYYIAQTAGLSIWNNSIL